MRYLMSMAVCGMLAFVATADEKKPVDPLKPVKPADPTKDEAGVREIDLKDVKLAEAKGGKASEPTVIKSEDDLKKAVGEDAAKAMKIDFKKEYLALFQWAGSGQDKLTHAVETKDKKTTVTTTYTRGFTKDLKQHAHLIALPAGAEWVMAK
jgi:hypothetical protein